VISKISSAFCVLCSRGAIKARCRFCVRQALQTHASSKARCHPPLILCTLHCPAPTSMSVPYYCCTSSVLCCMHHELPHEYCSAHVTAICLLQQHQPKKVISTTCQCVRLCNANKLASCWSHVQVPEFQGLPASTIESLALVLTEKVFAPKAVIYHQGSEVEDVYFVQGGTVTVSPYHSSYNMTFALTYMRAARLELMSCYDDHEIL